MDAWLDLSQAKWMRPMYERALGTLNGSRKMEPIRYSPTGSWRAFSAPPGAKTWRTTFSSQAGVEERKELAFSFRWLFLWVLQVTIGYGWRDFWALGWVAFFTLFGTCVLRWKDEIDNDGANLGFWYSLDMLLPIIHLREKHYDLDLNTEVAQRYMYIHKIVGYILMFFVIAGLSGLTE